MGLIMSKPLITPIYEPPQPHNAAEVVSSTIYEPPHPHNAAELLSSTTFNSLVRLNVYGPRGARKKHNPVRARKRDFSRARSVPTTVRSAAHRPSRPVPAHPPPAGGMPLRRARAAEEHNKRASRLVAKKTGRHLRRLGDVRSRAPEPRPPC